MSPDPNWFYSSLAQCAAALVGLLGAVVVTRMQQQVLDARESANDLRNRLNLFRHDLQTLDPKVGALASTFIDSRDVRAFCAAVERQAPEGCRYLPDGDLSLVSARSIDQEADERTDSRTDRHRRKQDSR